MTDLERAPPLRVCEPEAIEGVVLAVNAVVRRKGLEMARDVGRLVLDHFFDGDPALFRAPSRGRRTSFRRLAEHPALEVSASALHAYVAISIQLAELPPGVAAALPLTKHRYLLPLKDLRAKAELGRRCIDEEWSAERLRREVSAARPSGARSGRLRTPVVVKIVKDLERAFDVDRLRALEDDLPEPEEVAELLVRLEEAERMLRSVRQRLAGRQGATPGGTG